MKVMI